MEKEAENTRKRLHDLEILANLFKEQIREKGEKIEKNSTNIAGIYKELSNKISWKVFSLAVTVLLVVVGGMFALVWDKLVDIDDKGDATSEAVATLNGKVENIDDAIINQLLDRISFTK
jgi:hypothetical protein